MKSLKTSLLILSIIALSFSFAGSVLAEETTPPPAETAIETPSPVEEPAVPPETTETLPPADTSEESVTPPPEETSTDAPPEVLGETTTEEETVVEEPETPAPQPIFIPAPVLQPPPSPAPEPLPAVGPVFEQGNPTPQVPGPAVPPVPTVEPVVPFVSRDGRAFDPAIAPSIVKLKLVTPDGTPPTTPVFVSFVGVAGRTFGGQLNGEGEISAILPTGRYYTDIMVVDTKLGPPDNPPAFFLEANTEKDFGILPMSNKSSFQDPALEKEVGEVLGTDTASSKGGLSRIFSLIIKLLMTILQEVRSVRVDMINQ